MTEWALEFASAIFGSVWRQKDGKSGCVWLINTPVLKFSWYNCEQDQNFKGPAPSSQLPFVCSSAVSPDVSCPYRTVAATLVRVSVCVCVRACARVAYSACDRTVILTVCKPFEHCLNTRQPLLHPTHARRPNISSKRPPIDSGPATGCSYTGTQQGGKRRAWGCWWYVSV